MSIDKPYAFKREDSGAIEWVDYQTMMTQDCGGWITLSDGVEARRCLHLERRKAMKRTRTVKGNANGKPAPSDSLGFPEQCLKKFEADRKKHGFTDIEFKRDPDVPEFYQVHCGSQAAKDRYTKHRHMVNRTGSLGSAVSIDASMLERAEEWIKKLYGTGDKPVLKSQGRQVM